MPVAGIICEYNPFHNGHAYQIQQLKTEYGMDTVVCAMSGHFMQRGEPALIHKLDRTKMALAAGADLVLELPTLFSTRSAYWFALGGVSLLAGTGIVTHLAFGAENNDLAALQQTALHLSNPSKAFHQSLKARLKEGLAFVEAQALALHDQFKTTIPNTPNDRLALCYLQVVAEKSFPLAPILIPRKEAAYHQIKPNADSLFASANAIRQILETAPAPQEGLEKVKQFLPVSSMAILQEILNPHAKNKVDSHSLRPVYPKDLEQILLALLRRTTSMELRQLPDMTEGLENRILYCSRHSQTMNDFYKMLKTKRYSMTRLQRAMIHLFLNYKAELASEITLGCPYIRILGCTSKGQTLLSQIKAHSDLPLISRSGQLKTLCRQQKASANTWDLEVRSGDLYALLQGQSIGGSPEYKLQPIMP